MTDRVDVAMPQVSDLERRRRWRLVLGGAADQAMDGSDGADRATTDPSAGDDANAGDGAGDAGGGDGEILRTDHAGGSTDHSSGGVDGQSGRQSGGGEGTTTGVTHGEGSNITVFFTIDFSAG